MAKTPQINFRIPDEYRQALAEIARRDDRSQAYIVKWLIRQEAEKRGIKLKKTKPIK